MSEIVDISQSERIAMKNIFEIGLTQKTHLFDARMSLRQISLTNPFILLRKNHDPWLYLDVEKKIGYSDTFVEYDHLGYGFYGLTVVEPSFRENEKLFNFVIGEGVGELERVVLCVDGNYYYALKFTGRSKLSERIAYVPYQEITETDVSARLMCASIPLWGLASEVDDR